MALPPLQDLLDLLPDNTVGDIGANDMRDIVTALYMGITTASSPPSSIPEGTSFYFSGDVVPTGFMEEDGRSLVRSVYPKLFATIGTRYGFINALEFNIPDSRGMAVRAVSGTSNVDPDKNSRTDSGDGTVGNNVGTKQDSETRTHSHFIASNVGGNNATNLSTSNFLRHVSSAIAGYSLRGFTTAATVGKTSSFNGASETRMVNIYKRAIIRVDYVNSFISADLGIAALSSGSLVHGMVSIPSGYKLFLKNIIADAGYLPGNLIPIDFQSVDGAANSGVALRGTSSVIDYKIGASGLYIMDLTTGVIASANVLNWKLVIEASTG